MARSPLTFWDEVRLGSQNLADYAKGAITPTFRLGVTGLSRAGKTVFITSLINALLNGGRLPLFEPLASGRIKRVFLDTQPDDTCPRFPFESNVAALKGEPPQWPQSTTRISQIRLTIEFQSGQSLLGLGRNRLHLDIIDYPGEWLLDLPLLTKTYEDWCGEAWQRAESHLPLSEAWRDMASRTDGNGAPEEEEITALSDAYKDYLRSGRDARYALSTLPPGRFLMPGDMEGSPALTFSPLPPLENGETAAPGSLRSEMARRYDAYCQRIAKPFFRDSFATLDAQIVLVDLLSALNAGPEAMGDLEEALEQILSSFRFGTRQWYSAPFKRKIGRVVFAASRADHLHARQHDALEDLLKALVADASQKIGEQGAAFSFAALAALRATRQGEAKRGGINYPCVIGKPAKGEAFGGKTYDGETEVALFPGDLPDKLKNDTGEWQPFSGMRLGEPQADFRFLRFAPPQIDPSKPWPHIRLDQLMEAALGDALK